MIERRERIRSLLLLQYQGKTRESKVMSFENPLNAVEGKIHELLEDMPGYFLVETNIKPTNNIKVFVDADQGADIGHLSTINKVLYKWVEENLFPNGDFSIEVSSPGLDEPIKLDRQIRKNIGRYVEVLMIEGTRKEGKLKEVGVESIIVIEEKGKGKKKEFIEHLIKKEEIKTLKIQIKF